MHFLETKHYNSFAVECSKEENALHFLEKKHYNKTKRKELQE